MLDDLEVNVCQPFFLVSSLSCVGTKSNFMTAALYDDCRTVNAVMTWKPPDLVKTGS